MVETTIIIEGIMCGHCKMAVTKALSDLEGVEDVDVSMESGQAKVNYNSDKIDIVALKVAIIKAGYKAQ